MELICVLEFVNTILAMKKKAKIKYVEDGEHGAGFLLATAADGFTPGSGLTIAHDLLEHFPKDSGKVHEEAMAFGAILWIRGMNNFFQRNTPGYSMSGDIANQFTEFGGCMPFTKKVNLTKDIDEEIPRWLNEGVNLAWAEIESNLDDASDNMEAHTETQDEFTNWSNEWVKWALYGYKRVQARYKDIDSWNVFEVFQDIMKAVDKLKPEYDGQEFVIHYGTEGTTIHEKEYA